MKITELKIKNFKRFTDLTISAIPPETKLVLLVGANGSGKTSVFDAFEWLSKLAKDTRYSDEDEYYKKELNAETAIDVFFSDGKAISRIDSNFLREANKNSIYNLNPLAEPELRELARKFYGRSSLRIVPQISNINFNENIISQDSDRPAKYIDYDKRFDTDVTKYIQDIGKATREILFSDIESDKVLKIRGETVAKYIEPFNKSLTNIFGDDENTAIRLIQYDDASNGNPPKLIFKKGKSTINYDLLSHGEKQVVIILLNFLVRDKKDAIFFIDEMDVHLNTSLQYNLLKEICQSWISADSQLWTASHSLGFIEFARDFTKGVVLDFDQMDFDEPQRITPETSVDIFEIAVPKTSLAKMFQGKNITICENKDDELYNSLDIENTVFIGVRSAESIFLHIKSEQGFAGIRDGDFFTESEKAKLKATFPKYKLLGFYNIENYLYHPENIAELVPGFDKNNYLAEILRQKKERQLKVLNDVVKIRTSYEELKIASIKDSDIAKLNDDIVSEDFASFYKYFDMKRAFKKDSLSSFGINRVSLAKTYWFKMSIKAILEG